MRNVALGGLMALGVGVFGIAACQGGSDPKEPATNASPSIAKTITDRAQGKFQKARFLKPRKLDPAQMEHEFAPLIVEEVSDSKSEPKSGFIDFVSNRAVLEPHTVYFRAGQLHANGRLLDQVCFLWAYQDVHVNPGKETTIRGMSKAVRIILGSDGMPILWEASSSTDKARVFFIAKSVEDAAKKEFGAPLAGRTYAVERSREESLDIVVAGLVEDGPVPMGPYVYVDGSSDKNITAIRCRCSPSQFEEAVETVEYDLLPMENVDEQLLRDRTGFDLDKVMECPPLETYFRWPKLTP